MSADSRVVQNNFAAGVTTEDDPLAGDFHDFARLCACHHFQKSHRESPNLYADFRRTNVARNTRTCSSAILSRKASTSNDPVRQEESGSRMSH
jgi:hypothetical protein